MIPWYQEFVTGFLWAFIFPCGGHYGTLSLQVSISNGGQDASTFRISGISLSSVFTRGNSFGSLWGRTEYVLGKLTSAFYCHILNFLSLVVLSNTLVNYPSICHLEAPRSLNHICTTPWFLWQELQPGSQLRWSGPLALWCLRAANWPSLFGFLIIPIAARQCHSLQALSFVSPDLKRADTNELLHDTIIAISSTLETHIVLWAIWWT